MARANGEFGIRPTGFHHGVESGNSITHSEFACSGCCLAHAVDDACCVIAAVHGDFSCGDVEPICRFLSVNMFRNLKLECAVKQYIPLTLLPATRTLMRSSSSAGMGMGASWRDAVSVGRGLMMTSFIFFVVIEKASGY